MSANPRLARGIARQLLELAAAEDMTLEQALDAIEEADGADARAEMVELIETELDLESTEDFIARITPHEPAPPHTRPLRDFFERARYEQVFEGHSWPPRHAKTTMIVRCLARHIVQNPADLNGYVTFSHAKARSHSRIIRELVERAGVKLSKTARSLNEWRTEQGGGLLAAGARGGINGYGISGILVYDDPYRSMQDATSPRLRETIQEIAEGTLFTRLEGGSVLVVHTRWDLGDLLGWLKKEKGWRVINIEAIAPDPASDPEAEPDPCGRKPGEALWAERYPVEACSGPCGHAGHLNVIREMVGPYVWGALFCGRPPRRGSTVFKDATYYDPEDYKVDGHRPGTGIDPAATAKTSADWSVALNGGMRGTGGLATLDLWDYWRGQVELPELVDAILPMLDDWPGAPVFAEAVGGFKFLPQTLRKIDLTRRQALLEDEIKEWMQRVLAEPKLQQPTLGPQRMRIIPIYPSLDKLMRAQAVAAAWNAGRVRLPKGRPWVAGFVARIQAFTGMPGKEDDDADALSMLWNGLWKSTTGTGMSTLIVQRSAGDEEQMWD
jgi:predicted phage terminase large subunit-like protein